MHTYAKPYINLCYAVAVSMLVLYVQCSVERHILFGSVSSFCCTRFVTMCSFFVLSIALMLILHRHVDAASRFWPCPKSALRNGLCSVVDGYGNDHVQGVHGSDSRYGKDSFLNRVQNGYENAYPLSEGDDGHGKGYIMHRGDDGLRKDYILHGGDDGYEEDHIQFGWANDDDDDDDGGWPAYNVVNVDWYDAMGDGVTDDSQAFADAWSDACALDSAVLMIPQNRTYLLSPLELKGPCGSKFTVELAGTLIAPSDPSSWNKTSSNAWLHFSQLDDFRVEGGGSINGQGQQWWAQSCKKNKTNKCFDAPTALKFSRVNGLQLRSIQSIDSPQIHIFFSNCFGVRAFDVEVQAPGDSPNTDGIHVAGSQNVLIQDANIQTGDDCISIVSGSTDIRVKNVTCGPGHGISIGSLGKGGSNDHVTLVVVDGAKLTGTTNGLRIKTWKDGTGSAVGFRFQNVEMNNVSYPIIIDQSYCDWPNICPVNETSAVQVSQIFYRNIWGTSATKQAIKLACSPLTPCTGLRFENINLMPAAKSKPNITSFCQSAQGVIAGIIVPNLDCLQSPQPRWDLSSLE